MGPRRKVKPHAYSYLRFSTPEQSKGDSKRRQTDLAERWAAANDVELDTSLTFHDLGVSAFRGKNKKKGALGSFLEAVEAGLVPEGSILLVESLDRISRQDALLALNSLNEIVSSGVDIVTLSDGKRYTAQGLLKDSMSLLMSLMIFIRANEESTMKAKRVAAAWKGKRLRAAASGEVLTARAPSWLRTVINKKTGLRRFELIPERARIVRQIFKWTLDGKGQHWIAEKLNKDKVPVFGRGKFWGRSFVSKILTSSTTYGILTPHSSEERDGRRVRIPLDPIPDYYPAVISEEDFVRVQSLRETRISPKLHRGKGSQPPIRNLLAGLLRCPKCGGSMAIVNKGEKGGKLRVVCAKAREGAGCSYHTVPYPDVEDGFLNSIERELALMPLGDAQEQLAEDLENVETAISETATKLERIVMALEKGGDSAILTARLKKQEEALEGFQARQARLLAKVAEAVGKLAERKRSEMLAAVQETPLDRQRVNALARQLFSGVTVDYEAEVLRLKWKHDGETEIPFLFSELREPVRKDGK